MSKLPVARTAASGAMTVDDFHHAVPVAAGDAPPGLSMALEPAVALPELELELESLPSEDLPGSLSSAVLTITLSASTSSSEAGLVVYRASASAPPSLISVAAATKASPSLRSVLAKDAARLMADAVS